MVCVHVARKWRSRRRACPVRATGQTESGNSDQGAPGHVEEGAHFSGLRTRPPRSFSSQAAPSGLLPSFRLFFFLENWYVVGILSR